jgi:radical SAM superfamily enzyme YgiQ (UPF0313 family)
MLDSLLLSRTEWGMRFINPVSDLGKLLLTIEKPARYVGGEYGRYIKPEAVLKTAIAFPDLYEIAMCNQALKILYNRLNQIDGVSCDRVFAPAPDFENLLRVTGIPLYGLDTGIVLGDLDLLLFTLGYELGITGVLSILESASIPLRAADRGSGQPLVIVGGPCVSNPLPFSRFIDAFWIGEAEDAFFDLTKELLALKQSGASRDDLLTHIKTHPSIWVPGKATARRAIDRHFSDRSPSAAVFPVPHIKVVQQHGAVEIMRGCPNGCRFCHAGFWYRPARQKPATTIYEEVAAFVKQGGYHEISLSSLSSGDYQYLGALVDTLNNRFMADHVSFQLPSLRVSGFSLPVLEKIAAVRRSGLTFAVETPDQCGQFSLNKEVSRDSVIAILQEAKKHGWHGAKFYFMIGLPVQTPDTFCEEQAIVSFIRDIASRTHIHFTINVGTFVPKPHTPYQNAPQLDEETARKKLDYIRSSLRPGGHKVSVQDPFFSLLEGVICRGDERIGAMIEQAYYAGCRLDAWNEHCKKDQWRIVFDQYADLMKEVLSGKQSPWSSIESGTQQQYYRAEQEKSARSELTTPCAQVCPHHCGICTPDNKIVNNTIHDAVPPTAPMPVSVIDTQTYRILFSFSKAGPAIFQSHLSVIEMFSAAFTRAGVPVVFSQGFNPLPRLEIAAPLAVGISARAEVAIVDTTLPLDAAAFIDQLNPALPEGMRVEHAIAIRISLGAKKYSLASLLWGFLYAPDTFVPAADEKAYRHGHSEVFGLERIAVLARCQPTPDQPRQYFDAYPALYQKE